MSIVIAVKFIYCIETSKTKSDRKDNRCEYLIMSTDTSLVLFPTYGDMHVILQKIHDNRALIALSGAEVTLQL